MINTNKASNVTDVNLAPHLQRRSGVSSVIIADSTANNTSPDSIIAGEAINEYDFIAFQNGAAYRASLDKPANAIAINAGDAGDMIYYKRNLFIASATVLTLNKPIYLTTGTVNYTSTLPTIATNQFYQVLGFAYSTSQIYVDIRQAYIKI